MELSRRDFLKAAGVCGGLILAGATYRQIHNTTGRDFHPELAKAYLAGIQPHPHPEALPNILIILCDDLGYGDLDSPALDLPNLRRMASEGIRLTSFYAPAAVCSPSRAGLLTGRYPVRTLITTPLLSTSDAMNIVMDVLGRYSYDVRGIPQDEVLLPEALSRRGYHTCLVGKWHLGGTSGYLPNERGFDSFYGALWSNDDEPYAIYRDRLVAAPAPADQTVLTRNFTLAAQDFMRSHKDQPFFLELAHAMPLLISGGNRGPAYMAMLSRSWIGAWARFSMLSTNSSWLTRLWLYLPAITVPGGRETLVMRAVESCFALRVGSGFRSLPAGLASFPLPRPARR